MKALKPLAFYAHEIVWMIGWFVIITYSQAHWPLASKITVVVLVAAAVLGFLWLYFVRPFRAGLQESCGASGAARHTLHPEATPPHFLSNVMSPKEVLTKWAAAFNDRNAAAAASLYHEHATNLQVAIGSPVQGRQGIHDDLVSLFTAFPDSYTHVEHIFEEGEWAMIEWSGGGTFSGPLGEHTPTGKSFTLRGCGFFQVIAGKIHLQRGYWDKATWFRQIGLPID
jgi:steroid delta-isomerase-like uncharacterized protein